MMLIIMRKNGALKPHGSLFLQSNIFQPARKKSSDNFNRPSRSL